MTGQATAKLLALSAVLILGNEHVQYQQITVTRRRERTL